VPSFALHTRLLHSQEHKAAIEERVQNTRVHIEKEKAEKLATVANRHTSFAATLEPKKKARLAHLERLSTMRKERLQEDARKVTELRKEKITALTKAKQKFVQEHLSEIELEKRRREELRKEAVRVPTFTLPSCFFPPNSLHECDVRPIPSLSGLDGC
jgi:hypothetical protein